MKIEVYEDKDEPAAHPPIKVNTDEPVKGIKPTKGRKNNIGIIVAVVVIIIIVVTIIYFYAKKKKGSQQ
jgi:t-SNARE complex subunit (syntaxin)